MLNARTGSALEAVEKVWNSSVSELSSLVQELLVPPTWQMSGILIETVRLGKAGLDERAIAACCALEFLEQSLRLGEANHAGHRTEDHLLITDCLYAQAIDRVISIDRPYVIGVLARVIMGTAEDRVNGADREYRHRLIASALEIGAHLGDVNGSHADAVATAADEARLAVHDQWADTLPAGPVKDYLCRSLSPAGAASE